MSTHIVSEVYPINIVAEVLIALVYMIICSPIKEPYKQHFNALVIAGAGAVYWNGGLGIAEYIFGMALMFVAFAGLYRYTWIGIGWLLHAGWDILHHVYASPIVPFSPASSAGCAICDTILAFWFFKQAPHLFLAFKNKKSMA